MNMALFVMADEVIMKKYLNYFKLPLFVDHLRNQP
jgi:hypothetical protein